MSKVRSPASLRRGFRDFFGANSVLSAEAVIRDEGGVTLNALTLATGTLDLRASGETSPDNFLRRLLLQATIADPTGEPVVLPGGGGTTTVGETRLSVDYGADASENWSGALNIRQLSTAQFDAAEVAVTFGGVAENLDQPDARRLTFSTEGAVTGITTADPAVETALGNRIDLVVDGEWTAGQPVELAEASLRAQALALELQGVIDDLVFGGTIGVVADSIAPFSDLAGRELAGSIDLQTEGTVAFTAGGFDLTFDGSADDLQLGIGAVDALLASPVRLSGRLGRGAQGFVADEFTIENDEFRFSADGRYASDAADVTLEIALSDLALVTDRAEGRIEIEGSATGEGARSRSSLWPAFRPARLRAAACATPASRSAAASSMSMQRPEDPMAKASRARWTAAPSSMARASICRETWSRQPSSGPCRASTLSPAAPASRAISHRTRPV
jgi:translocation and assembly module TamB